MNKSMGSVVVSAIAAALLAGWAMPAEASKWRLDFDNLASATEDGGDMLTFNSGQGTPQLYHGRIMDNEYAGGVPGINLDDNVSIFTGNSSPAFNLDSYDKAIGFNSTSAHSFGVTISANNYNSSGNDHAVLFNTNLHGTRDPDMEDLFTTVDPHHPSLDGVGSHRPGHVLIIQEYNVNECGGGIRCQDSSGLGTADDEGDRPAGEIIFEFDELVNVEGLDFFDVEYAETDPQPKIYGFLDDGDNIADFEANVPNTGGDNKFDRVTFNFTNINRLVVEMGGSGGIDNLYGSRNMTSVPEPGPLAVFATGFLALMVARRRLKTA